jgi:hypothetical protein
MLSTLWWIVWQSSFAFPGFVLTSTTRVNMGWTPFEEIRVCAACGGYFTPPLPGPNGCRLTIKVHPAMRSVNSRNPAKFDAERIRGQRDQGANPG